MQAEIYRFLLRLPHGLYLRLKEEATRQNLSLNALCNQILDCGSRGLPQGINLPLMIAEHLVPAAVLNQILSHYKSRVQALFLFGSSARGAAWDTSDIDLLIVLDDGEAVQRSLYHEWDLLFPRASCSKILERITPQFVNCAKVNPRAASGLWLEVAIDGIALYDPNLKISKFLADIRGEILAGRYKRCFASGQPYWVRNEEAA